MSRYPSVSSVSTDPAAVPPLLGSGDQPPFEVVNAEGRRPLVLICDHASRAVPGRLGRLGLEDWVFERHVAWDIGAAGVTRLLAERLDAPAVLGGYSRLVVDVNRQPGHPGSIPAVSDGIAVPANANLSAQEAQARLDALFWPYHRCVGDLLAGHWVRQDKPPVLFSIHSFTPCLADGGTPRPWHAGILWNRDPRVALPLIELLRQEPGLMVGDNEPYSGRTGGYSVEIHAGAAGLPCAAVEVRQDLIADNSGVAVWADRLGRALERVLGQPDLHSVRHYVIGVPGMPREPSFTVGVEEEYLLVDRDTRDLVPDPPPELLPECEALLAGQVVPEFLRCQIEVGTRIGRRMSEIRSDLARLRRTVAEVAERHGLAVIAASTHPFAEWDAQKHTDKERYNALARDLGGVARRLVICGMHVHVAVEDEDLRIDLLGQIPYFLPHLLALSTSSPFWRGEDTGLKSYRLAVFNELPRTGLPERFDSYGEYRRHVNLLVEAGLIQDASKLWWDVRPSARFPTLEMRVTDVCTRLDDAIAVAALYRCLLRMLWRLRRGNQRWRLYADMLVNENRWRAQRYGFEEGLVDFGKGRVVAYGELLEEIIALVAEDAAFFDCAAEVAHARDILARGTSAHRQLAAYREAREGGADHKEALRAVVDMLVGDTISGV